MTNNSLGAEEARVIEKSASFKKELGLRDLVLMQIAFVVGGSWVGTAAKLGSAQTVYWLLAILLFYIPLAAIIIYLNRLMPLEGGLYQWAKLGFNEFTGFMVGWNLWLLGITVMAGTGLVIATNLFYAIGPAASWLPANHLFVGALNGVLVGAMILVTIRGLSLGKWVNNVGGILLLATYGGLILLPFIAVAAGKLPHYRAVEFALPPPTLFSLNIFSKISLGALAGFEYVAILAGESRAPEKNITRSVIIAAPIIALMFILGTSSVMAFTSFDQLDLIGPVPQALRAGVDKLGATGSTIAALAILMLAGRSIAVLSIYFLGNTRLPMVAGWDNVLPRWFSKLHRRYKTPTNSILFVGAVTLLFAIGSLLGVGAQEAFQLIDNAAGIFYAIAYLVLFAVPVIGLRGISARAPLWLRIAAVIGALVTLLYIVFTVIPIVPVQSRIGFAARVVGTVVISNLIGALIFVTGERRQRARARANA
ncbi:MAG: APC family permease [Chthoniobacterales bacterium]